MSAAAAHFFDARVAAPDPLIARAVAAGVPEDLARVIVALAESNVARDYAARLAAEDDRR